MTENVYAITMPKWGIEMQEGTVVDWHLDEGAAINSGDELIDIETDKIVNTMEAPVTGLLRRRLAPKGDTLKVGSLLGIIAAADVDDTEINAFIAGFEPADAGGGAAEEAAAPETAGAQTLPPAATPAERPKRSGSKRVRVSPAAARRAKELGVDISQVESAGRRITPADVERHAEANAAGGGAAEVAKAYESLPLSATRKSIARRLVESKQQIPHFYLTIDINMDKALERRAAAGAGGTGKVTLNDIVARAVVLALQAVPDVNIHLVGDEIRRFSRVNLAIAVATDKGLITPVVQSAGTMDMTELAQAIATLGEQARNAALTREQIEGGTFTISNLGMYGVSEFQAIINPPQGALLALGACEKRIAPGFDTPQMASMMHATLSCDHRAIDGALGARFLAKLKTILENPAGSADSPGL